MGQVVNQQLGASRAVAFPSDRVRSLFPALNQKAAFVFFDNAAGAQIPQVVFDAIHRHLLYRNVQRGGRYTNSMEADDAIARARDSGGVLINARHRNEIALGMNATSFLRLLSLAIGRTLKARNEIVVTELDHEANIATWVRLQNYSRNPAGSLKRVAEEPTQDLGRDGPREVRLPCLSEIPCDSSSQATSARGSVAFLDRSRRRERHGRLLEGEGRC